MVFENGTFREQLLNFSKDYKMHTHFLIMSTQISTFFGLLLYHMVCLPHWAKIYL